ncbi:MAG: thioredoxin domain-containing protein [Chloroflexi bacterium]|nr:thioredoxin domain-containing protein [Chloroflexota bacterium]
MEDEDLMLQTPIGDEDWSSGPTDAPVQIVEYVDFECPHCREAHEQLDAIRAEFPDFRLVVRHFPITSIHPHAQPAAEAAEAAGAQGKFWEMHDLLFEHQDRLDPDDLHGYAQQLGLDVERFDRELSERTYESRVKQSFRNGIGDGVNGTPTIFINGVRYDGPRDHETFLEVLKQVAAQAG